VWIGATNQRRGVPATSDDDVTRHCPRPGSPPGFRAQQRRGAPPVFLASASIRCGLSPPIASAPRKLRAQDDIRVMRGGDDARCGRA
jgi:hypothetical protein